MRTAVIAAAAVTTATCRHVSGRMREGVENGMFVDLTQYLWILWLALVVLFVVIELVTLEFTFLMIAAGSLIGGLGSNLLGWDWWVQIGLAAIISALLIFTIRPLLLLTLRKGGDPARSNVEALYGQGARVMTNFVEGNGVVKLDNGETWTSRLAPVALGATLVEGDRVVVTTIDGAIAVVALPGSVAATPETPLPAPAT